MELHKSGYTSQIAAYLRNKNYEKAYTFSKEFVQKFPNEMVAHYLLSQSAFWVKKYGEAALEGSRAFNKSDSRDDMLACAVITASAYYELKEYEKGHKLLEVMARRKTNESLESLFFLFSIARNDGRAAAEHLNELYRLNQQAAKEMAARYFK